MVASCLAVGKWLGWMILPVSDPPMGADLMILFGDWGPGRESGCGGKVCLVLSSSVFAPLVSMR